MPIQLAVLTLLEVDEESIAAVEDGMAADARTGVTEVVGLSGLIEPPF